MPANADLLDKMASIVARIDSDNYAVLQPNDKNWLLGVMSAIPEYPHEYVTREGVRYTVLDKGYVAITPIPPKTE